VSKTILIIATLDTKGKETGYLRDLILRGGHKPLIIDLGSGDEAFDEIMKLKGAV